MATLVPPPSKRQKLDAAVKAEKFAQQSQIPDDLGSIRIQFIDQSTGKSTGPAVAVPVKDATVKNLETLLNTIQGHDSSSSERLPYRFFFRRERPSLEEADVLDVQNDVYNAILKPGFKTTEDTVTLQFTPQAVFRVKPVSRCSASIAGHGEAILTTSFSPETSSRLATGSGDNTARIWDCDTGTPLHTLRGHTSWVLVVSWSPDGKILATGSMDNTVRLWDPKTGEPLGGPLKGHTKWITSLAWEPYHNQHQGKPRLASSSKDGTVRIWDVPLRRVEQVLSGHKSSVTCVRWGGLHRIYTACQDKTIKVWNDRTWTCLHTLTAHTHWVNHLALSTDFALKTSYHSPTEKPPTSTPEKISKAKQRFEAAALHNGVLVERLLSASDDNTIFLWDTSTFDPDSKATPKPVTRLLGHQKQVLHVSFSPDASTIASTSFDNSVKLWSAATGAFITTLRGHVGAVYMASWSADSRLLASASKDSTVKIWDVKNGKLKEDLPGHKDEVYALDWSSDGNVVGSGGRDKVVKIWKY
jgi:ribosome assembly protein 4